MFTATSDTQHTIVFPELQDGQDLPLLRWSPGHETGPEGFLHELNRLGHEINPNDLKTYTLIAAPSNPIGNPTFWQDHVQQKYGSIKIVFDEGIKQEVSREEVGEVRIHTPITTRVNGIRPRGPSDMSLDPPRSLYRSSSVG